MLPAGVLTESYSQDKAIIRTKFRWCAFFGFLLFLAFLPTFISRAWLGAISLTAIYLIAVLGLQVVVGFCGQINLGQSAFMGVGGIIGCVAATKYHVPFEISLLIGGAAATVFGLFFALPAVRVKGFYLALTTLAAQFVFDFIFVRIPPEFFGGLYGGLHVDSITLLTGHTVTSHEATYYVMMFLAGLFVFFTLNIYRSRLGKAFMAIRDNENAAGVMGVNVTYYKFLSFVVASFFAGVSGVLMGFYMGWTNVEQFSLFLSVWMLGMIIVGGVGTVLGAIMGTVVLRGLQEAVNVLGPYLSAVFPNLASAVWFPMMNLIIGVIIVLVLVFEPRGLAHRWRIIHRFYWLWPFPY